MSAPRSAMAVDNFKSTQSGALVGFVDVIFLGIVMLRCQIFSKDNRAWASPPAKQIIGKDGAVLRGADGKVRYEQTVTFVDRPTQERWSAAVIEAFRAAYPEVLR